MYAKIIFMNLRDCKEAIKAREAVQVSFPQSRVYTDKCHSQRFSSLCLVHLKRQG